ncbi:MAG: hypothetical protein HYZ91_02985 [Candidatus Omnitrophica bacterium]|nr:hypothetical protein [Candidatus Omnitrophota bacterium]
MQHRGNRRVDLHAHELHTTPRVVRPRQAGKTLVPLLSVLVVLAMGVAGVAIFLQMQERDRRQAKERELQLALAENDDLKVRLQDLQQTKSRMETELTRARTELTQAQEELAKSTEAKETLARSIEDREREISRLTKEMEQTQRESKQSADRLAELQKLNETAKQQLADLRKAKEQLEAKVMELSGQPLVELDKVTVSDQKASGAEGMVMPASATVATPSNGQIVVVNREYDFIVMNLGKNQGLSVGQEFQIVRGDEVLGKVKVEKVYDELSAATILPESQKNNIREGDTVKAL